MILTTAINKFRNTGTIGRTSLNATFSRVSIPAEICLFLHVITQYVLQIKGKSCHLLSKQMTKQIVTYIQKIYRYIYNKTVQNVKCNITYVIRKRHVYTYDMPQLVNYMNVVHSWKHFVCEFISSH